MSVLRAFFVVALLFAVGVAAQDSSDDLGNAPGAAVTATPEPVQATSPQLPASTPTPLTNSSVTTGPKKTPGRHCDVREGCAECLALSYCVWSPSKSTCLDKTKATRRDNVVTTCDPVVCAQHGGPPVDRRVEAHVTAKLAGVRGRSVVAEAVAVDRLPRSKTYNPLPHLTKKNRRVSFPRTTSDDKFVKIKKAPKYRVFESDNRGPIIRGEAEERQAQFLAEKRLHRKLLIKQLLVQQNLLAKPKKSKFRTPAYYPSKKEKIASMSGRALARAVAAVNTIHRDSDLKDQLYALRSQADHALHARRYLVEEKRRKIEDVLERLSDEITKVNEQATVIDTDDTAFEAIKKDITALSAKVQQVCSTTFSLLETQSDAEIDQSILAEESADVDADADSESEVDADSEVDSESEVDAETATDIEGELDSEIESETEGFESE